MTTEHGHSPQEVAQRLAAGARNGRLKDVVFGGIDGTITTFAIVAGVEGAGLSQGVIVALGIANVLADGFSMASGNYSGTKAEMDDRKRIIRIEHDHIENHRAGELEELRQILALRGLRGRVLAECVSTISQDPNKWVELMLTDEYGLSRDAPEPVWAALATFGSFLIFGMVPLIPFILGVPSAFVVSTIATLATFFLIGTGKSRWSLSQWWVSGLETLSIGAVAALIAYGVGSLFHLG